MTRVRVLAVAGIALVSLSVGVVGLAVGDRAGGASTGSGSTAPRRVLGPGPVTVVMRVEHSRFVPDVVRVRPGTEVRFVVVNDDPINHELIVGSKYIHDLHEAGNHGSHPAVPGEVTVPASDVGITTFRFDNPGRVLFACHLPGHFAYGMLGDVRVTRTTT